MATFVEMAAQRQQAGQLADNKASAESRIDPRYKDLVNASTRQADSYSANLPSMQAQQANLATDNARVGLAKSLAGADRTANARGMLYGGVRQGLRANAESTAAGNLSDQIRQGNVASNQTGEDLNNAGIQAGENYMRDLNQSYNDVYNEALSRRQQNQSSGLIPSLLPLGAGLAGSYLGSKGTGASKIASGGGAGSVGQNMQASAF